MRIVRNVARIFLWVFAIATFISMLCGPLFALLLLVSEPPRSARHVTIPIGIWACSGCGVYLGHSVFGCRIGRYAKRVPSRRA